MIMIIKKKKKKKKRTGETYRAEDIARYIIKTCSDREYGISNRKLQKLLYFVQAYFLVEADYQKKAFFDRIEAWTFGPVVPSVYRKFRRFGAMTIPFERTYITEDEGSHWGVKRVDYNDGAISDHDKKGINSVIEMFKDYSAVDMMNLTHTQQPWLQAYDPESPRENKEITPQSIKDYFSDDTVM